MIKARNSDWMGGTCEVRVEGSCLFFRSLGAVSPFVSVGAIWISPLLKMAPKVKRAAGKETATPIADPATRPAAPP